LLVKVRVGKRGTIVIPKEVRERLGISEGMILDLSVEKDKVVLRIRDLWIDLRNRGRKLKVNIDEAEKELDEADELWLKRLDR